LYYLHSSGSASCRTRSLGRGFLTGTPTNPAAYLGDWRSGLARFSGDAFAANRAALGAVLHVASELGAAPAQVALAWPYASGTRLRLPVVPIPGTRRASRVEENIASLDVSLDAGQLRAE
jgi:aryl-alcohol dehydrogenase-like predicted oxidoreductase